MKKRIVCFLMVALVLVSSGLHASALEIDTPDIALTVLSNEAYAEVQSLPNGTYYVLNCDAYIRTGPATSYPSIKDEDDSPQYFYEGTYVLYVSRYNTRDSDGYYWYKVKIVDAGTYQWDIGYIRQDLVDYYVTIS